MARELRADSRARSYRQHAHDCIQIAVKSANSDASEALLDLAFGWARMARQLDGLGAERERADADMFQGVQVLIMKPQKH